MEKCLPPEHSAQHVAYADRAPPAPDFGARPPSSGIHRGVAASDATARIAPETEISFAPDSCALGPDALVQLDAAASWLAEHPGYRIVLEANADTNVPEIATDLANRRASIVRNHLMSWGIAADRVVMLVGRDRKREMTLFASDQPVRKVVSAALDHGNAVAAVWTDRGTLFQEEQGLGQPRHEAIATRK